MVKGEALLQVYVMSHPSMKYSLTCSDITGQHIFFILKIEFIYFQGVLTGFMVDSKVFFISAPLVKNLFE